ncbi:MAG TPA: ABC transporter permease [Candidatus Acidoferrales bacterium]|nr:ABC transporter permease [Candidatus Acidoferrales bacterium]
MRGNRGRMAVALLAVVSGATVISALLDLQFDIEHQLTQQFRLLGANVVISRPRLTQTPTLDSPQPPSEILDAPALMDQPLVLRQVEKLPMADVAAAAPFFYIVAHAANTPVVVAGTWLDQIPGLEPTWRIDGRWVTARDDEADCLIGRRVARQFALVPGSSLDVQYLDRRAQVRVAGVIDAGGTEDSQIFVSLPIAQKLAGQSGGAQIELVQISVRGTSATIDRYTAQLAAALPGYEVRPIQAVSRAEGNLLDRTRLLIALMVALILVLTALCVLATMAALAMERRKDVGLMKALGGSISRIVSLFLAEVGSLGAAGGLIGSVLGVALARWMGQRVFGALIHPRWDIFPLTIALMVGVALAGALPLRLLGKVKPAVILRGE